MGAGAGMGFVSSPEDENGKGGETPHSAVHVEGWEFEMANMSRKPGDASAGAAFEASTSPPGVSSTPSTSAMEKGVDALHWTWGTRSPPVVRVMDEGDEEGKETGDDSTSTSTTLTPAPLTIATPTPTPALAAPTLTLRHPYAPKRSSPLASPRTSPPTSPLIIQSSGSGSPFVSPRTSPKGSPRMTMVESIPEEDVLVTAPSANVDRHARGHLHHAGIISRRARAGRVFPPDTDITPLVLTAVEKEEEDDDDNDDDDGDEGRHSANPKMAMPLSPSPSSSPVPSLDTDSVYQAFVRKWCFAGGSSGSGPGPGPLGATPRIGVSPSPSPVPTVLHG